MSVTESDTLHLFTNKLVHLLEEYIITYRFERDKLKRISIREFVTSAKCHAYLLLRTDARVYTSFRGGSRNS